ncbi:hypothetical protein, conserved [Entamoeba dispar SAW760]|uniref:NodB homology domain-containing protein n=1 Tax=Entamoeba dispar (strain ATCC PRA-260 / SAW760) TaxID=370354 RepID=B0EDH1_ENTDS|nr:uncharacterized protein EDI_093790 [Entamoeba dispar SAW760]EDR27588.1 hypothetical protein, conserved [Entamoeba dispar SAW760]|eukprot:EDR27588.1 hypothetical protein, conserved [Entamoeba dispar SAW760]
MKLSKTISIYLVAFVVLLIVTLIIVSLSVLFQSRWLMYFLEVRNPAALFYFDRNCKTKAVALTFDDSPSGGIKYLLRILKRNNATATFFMLGNKLQMLNGSYRFYPKLREDILNNGNDVGNHMFNRFAAYKMTMEDFEEQVKKTDALLQLGYLQNNKYNWFRPASFFPLGYMYEILDKYNYTMTLGTVHSFDFQIRNTQYNLFSLLGRIKSGDIIICHDTLETTEYVEKMIIYLKHQGYKVLSLSEMSRECPSSLLKKNNVF